MEISVHDTADAAFDYIDEFAARVQATAAPSDAVQLLVVDSRGVAVVRANAD